MRTQILPQRDFRETVVENALNQVSVHEVAEISDDAEDSQHLSVGGFYPPEHPRQNDNLCRKEVVCKSCEVVCRSEQSDEHDERVEHRHVENNIFLTICSDKHFPAEQEHHCDRDEADEDTEYIDSLADERLGVIVCAHHIGNIENSADEAVQTESDDYESGDEEVGFPGERSEIHEQQQKIDYCVGVEKRRQCHEQDVFQAFFLKECVECDKTDRGRHALFYRGEGEGVESRCEHEEYSEREIVGVFPDEPDIAEGRDERVEHQVVLR